MLAQAGLCVVDLQVVENFSAPENHHRFSTAGMGLIMRCPKLKSPPIVDLAQYGGKQKPRKGLTPV